MTEDDAVVEEEEEARGSTRPRPRGAEEGSRRAAEGRSPAGGTRRMRWSKGAWRGGRGGGLLESNSSYRAARWAKSKRVTFGFRARGRVQALCLHNSHILVGLNGHGPRTHEFVKMVDN